MTEYPPPDPRLEGKVTIQKLESRRKPNANGGDAGKNQAPSAALIAAKGNIAIAPDKLRAIHDEALRLHPLIVSGEILKHDAVGALTESGALYGVNLKCRPSELDRLIGEGLAGRPTLVPTVGPQRGDKLVTVCAADVVPEPVTWLWRGRIALGKLTLIAGLAGLGKSQLTLAMTAAVTTGGEWPCGEERAPLGNVIILSAEDGVADTIVPRLMAAGADLKRARIVSAVRSEGGKGRRAFNLQGDLQLLEKEIVGIGDVVLVIIDPISAYLGAKIDSHVNAAVRNVLEPVSELAARLRVALVAITHPPKSTGTAAINRFIGSIGFVAAARAAFMVMRDADDDDRRLFLPVKNNLSRPGQGLAFRLEQRIVGEPGKGIVGSSVVWENKPVTVTADQAPAAADGKGSNDEPTATDDVVDFLRMALADGPLPVKEVERQAVEAGLLGEGKPIGQSKPFRNARQALGIITGKGGMHEGWTWALPKVPSRPKMPSKMKGHLRGRRAPSGRHCTTPGTLTVPEPRWSGVCHLTEDLISGGHAQVCALAVLEGWGLLCGRASGRSTDTGNNYAHP
jgi:hypothetical protein